MVVRVVVNDSWEVCGEENVLFARPSYVPVVLLVPAFDFPSDCIVSAFVASVGAADLLLRWGALLLLMESSKEAKLPTRSEPGEKEEATPLVTLGAGGL